MEKRWTGKNVDLALLTTGIGDFLKEKQFEAIKGETASGYHIFAQGSLDYRLGGYVTVTIEGKPDDFTVKLEFSKENEKRSLSTMWLTTMFLSGYFLKAKLRAEEDWTKFKKDFWTCLDNLVGSRGFPSTGTERAL
jgi:hypothetical protein